MASVMLRSFVGRLQPATRHLALRSLLTPVAVPIVRSPLRVSVPCVSFASDSKSSSSSSSASSAAAPNKPKTQADASRSAGHSARPNKMQKSRTSAAEAADSSRADEPGEEVDPKQASDSDSGVEEKKEEKKLATSWRSQSPMLQPIPGITYDPAKPGFFASVESMSVPDAIHRKCHYLFYPGREIETVEEMGKEVIIRRRCLARERSRMRKIRSGTQKRKDARRWIKIHTAELEVVRVKFRIWSNMQRIEREKVMRAAVLAGQPERQAAELALTTQMRLEYGGTPRPIAGAAGRAARHREVATRRLFGELPPPSHTLPAARTSPTLPFVSPAAVAAAAAPTPPGTTTTTTTTTTPTETSSNN